MLAQQLEQTAVLQWGILKFQVDQKCVFEVLLSRQHNITLCVKYISVKKIKGSG